VSLTGERHTSGNLIRSIVFVLLVCGAIGFALVEARRALADRRARFVTFPDGSRVEFLGAVMGSGTFTTDNVWHRLARRYLPARIQSWLPAVIDCSGLYSDSNSATIILRLNNPTSVSGRAPWSGYTPADQNGFRYPGNGGYSVRSDARGNYTYAIGLRSFPRWEPKFSLHFADMNGVDVATLQVPNPTPGPFPVWQPSPLPQTRTNGPVTLTLGSLTEKLQTDGKAYYLSPKFNVRSVHPAWADAEANFQELLDATGNEGMLLSPREPAWKLRALVFRKRPKDFAANEQLVLTNLALPAPGQFQSLDQSADCNGVGVKVLVLAGAGSFGLSNGVTRFMQPPPQGTGGAFSSTVGNGYSVETWGSSTPFLLVEVRNAQPDDDIQIHLLDNSGREEKIETSRNGTASSALSIYKFAFDPPQGTKFVTLTLVVNRPLLFDFLVDPADVRIEKD
jgi:hypothetical protein